MRWLLAACLACGCLAAPNILFCISDDQSYAHTGANGDPQIQTPAFDRVAREGIRFTRAFCDAPTCGPSRSAILTGQNIWRLEQAGNIHSTLPAKFATYTEMLQDAGYQLGHTGKGWSPGPMGDRTENAAGKPYQARTYSKENRPKGVRNTNYARNFQDFLQQRPADSPFCFWLGSSEPHRGYVPNLWRGRDPAKVVVPPIFPDDEIVRRDILDYCHEIEHFDRHVGQAMALLEKRGELDNTIIVITSDHGMPFPRAKASLYDAGSHIPLAIRWPKGIQQPGRTYEGLVNLSDLAPTFLEVAGLKPVAAMTATSLLDIFRQADAPLRPAAFIAMERHDGCRAGGKGYPCRAIRTREFLYIRNFAPDRWPSGDPDKHNCARFIPFGEIDSSPTKTLMMAKKDRLWELAFGMRPAEELYDLRQDPHQMTNLVANSAYAAERQRLWARLETYLKETGDPRALGQEAPWDFYPYYGARRNPNWAVEGETQKQPGWRAFRGKPVDIQAAVDRFAPGWTIANCAGDMNPGFRDGILVTHPLNRSTGCTLSRTLTLPAGQPSLTLRVGHHPKGDWDLIVKANGQHLLQKSIGSEVTKDGWLDLAIDLSAYAGKEVKLELTNQPSGWAMEGGYWGKITVE